MVLVSHLWDIDDCGWQICREMLLLLAAAAAIVVGLKATDMTCSPQVNVDYNHGEGSLQQIDGLTMQQCCNACEALSACSLAVYSAWCVQLP